jgi:hypothetical protein
MASPRSVVLPQANATKNTPTALIIFARLIIGTFRLVYFWIPYFSISRIST